MGLYKWFLSLFTKKSKTLVKITEVTKEEEWRVLFSHFTILDPNFNSKNFPLEPKEKLTVIKEVSFGEWLSGHDVLHRLAQTKDGLANLRSARKYVHLNPVKPGHPVVATGVQWRHPKYDRLCVPVFQNVKGETTIMLHFIDGRWYPLTRWLVTPPPEEKTLPVI